MSWKLKAQLKMKWLIGVIVLVAIVFRFYGIESSPPGLFLDEAIEGNQAREALDTGRIEVFYPENGGREGMFVWLLIVPLKLFGNHPWVLRSVSGLIGVMTVVGLYFLTGEILNETAALIASFLLA